MTATYFSDPVGDKLLLIKSPASSAASQYEGVLISNPDDVRAYFRSTKARSVVEAAGDSFAPLWIWLKAARKSWIIGCGMSLWLRRPQRRPDERRSTRGCERQVWTDCSGRRFLQQRMA